MISAVNGSIGAFLYATDIMRMILCFFQLQAVTVHMQMLDFRCANIMCETLLSIHIINIINIVIESFRSPASQRRHEAEILFISQ